MTTVSFDEFQPEFGKERPQIFYFRPDSEKECENDEENDDENWNESGVGEER
jgi:hypothetical protein